tara:strand:+ start:343 stop:483 length:141 start_codon:yes stop_codon:yes gene_type:complete
VLNGATKAAEQPVYFKVHEVTGHTEVYELANTYEEVKIVVLVAPAL